jgi:hypothetical protein
LKHEHVLRATAAVDLANQPDETSTPLRGSGLPVSLRARAGHTPSAPRSRLKHDTRHWPAGAEAADARDLDAPTRKQSRRAGVVAGDPDDSLVARLSRKCSAVGADSWCCVSRW